MNEDQIRALRDTYKLVFNSEDGAKIIDDLEKRFHIHGTVFSAEATDTAYREGQRTVVLFIKQMLLDWQQL